MPSAVHFGVGDHGRAFNGLILSESGYKLTLIDMDEHLVQVLRDLKGYDVHVVGASSSSSRNHVSCEALGISDDLVVERLVGCDLVTTSVGEGRLVSIAPLLVAAIQKRKEKGIEAPLNVIACERFIRATTFLRQMVVDALSPEEETFAKTHVGFADCAWDRIVPGFEQHSFDVAGDPMQIAVNTITEKYFEWVIDQTHLKGKVPIAGATFADDLQPYISRTMFLLTAGHATVAYLGFLKGCKLISDSIKIPEVEKLARQVMGEVAQVHSRKFGSNLTDLQEYIEKSIARFKNQHIHDTVARVGGDPIRKLGSEERLVKPLLSTIKFGLANDGLCQAIGAALNFCLKEDSASLQLQQAIKQMGIEKVLKSVCGLSPHAPTHAQLDPSSAIDRIKKAYEGFSPSRPSCPVELPALRERSSAAVFLRSPSFTNLSKLKKKAVHFGAGKIGRGFIGMLLACAGYQVTFADVDKHMVGLLHKLQQYSVLVVSNNVDVVHVRNVDAVLSTDEAFVEVLASADLITTAVGVNILPRIAPVLARAIQRRREKLVEEPVNIIACENAVRATTALKAYVLEKLSPEDLAFAGKYVGFADSAVDRIAPNTEHLMDHPPESEEEELEVSVEEFFEWDVDKNQLKGEVPDIDSVTYCDNLQAYVERKLFTLNTGHATCAYLGYLKGYTMIHESINDPAIETIVRAAMKESSAVLIKRYGFDPVKHAEYIERIIGRFKNPHLLDEVTRVGRDPLRKLAVGDRFFKPFLGTLEYQVPNTNLCKGIAAALRYNFSGDEQAVRLQRMIAETGVAGALGSILPMVDKMIDETSMQQIVTEYDNKVFGKAEGTE